jgi:hypothetical protein
MLFLFATFTVFLGVPAHAEEVLPSATAKDAPPGRVHGSMSLHNGVWENARVRQKFERAAANYSLHIKLLTSIRGDYINNAEVYIKDMDGNDILDEFAGGPLYLVKAPT